MDGFSAVCYDKKRLEKRGKGMKFFHLSDLHIGKQLNGYSLQENQRAVLSQIAAYARE